MTDPKMERLEADVREAVEAAAAKHGYVFGADSIIEVRALRRDLRLSEGRDARKGCWIDVRAHFDKARPKKKA